MAVSPIEKPQGFLSHLSPSAAAGNLDKYLGEFRRVYRCTHTQGAKLATVLVTPWAGVVESIRSVQQVSGGGLGVQNTVDVAIGPVGSPALSVYALVADGNNLTDASLPGATQLNFPTEDLVLCADGETRRKFAKGDLIFVTSGGAPGFGVVDVEITIAQELIQGI